MMTGGICARARRSMAAHGRPNAAQSHRNHCAAADSLLSNPSSLPPRFPTSMSAPISTAPHCCLLTTAIRVFSCPSYPSNVRVISWPTWRPISVGSKVPAVDWYSRSVNALVSWLMHTTRPPCLCACCVHCALYTCGFVTDSWTYTLLVLPSFPPRPLFRGNSDVDQLGKIFE